MQSRAITSNHVTIVNLAAFHSSLAYLPQGSNTRCAAGQGLAADLWDVRP